MRRRHRVFARARRGPPRARTRPGRVRAPRRCDHASRGARPWGSDRAAASQPAGDGCGLGGSQARDREWALSSVPTTGRRDGRRAWIGREGEGTRGAHPRREVAASRGWRHGRSAPRLRTTRPPATAVSGNHNRWEKNGQSCRSHRLGTRCLIGSLKPRRRPVLNQGINDRINGRKRTFLIRVRGAGDGIPRRGAYMGKQSEMGLGILSGETKVPEGGGAHRCVVSTR